MSPLYIYNGKLLVVDGKLAANEACCCGDDPCSGPCDSAGDCAPGCDCVNGQCVGLCVETPNEIWSDCIGCPENPDGTFDCGTFCIPAGTGPPNIPGYTPCGAWVKFADAASDCIPCGNPFP